MWLCWGCLQDRNFWFVSDQCHGLWFWETPGYIEKPSESSCQPTDVLRYFPCSCVNSSGFLFQRNHFPLLPFPLLTILDKIRAPALALGIWSQQPVLLFVTDTRDMVYCFNKASLQIKCRWAWGTQPFVRLVVCFELYSLPYHPLIYPWLDLY